MKKWLGWLLLLLLAACVAFQPDAAPIARRRAPSGPFRAPKTSQKKRQPAPDVAQTEKILHEKPKPSLQPAQPRRQVLVRHIRANHGSNPVDLWVVGAGELGQRVIKIWKEKHPRSVVVAETLTRDRHRYLKPLGALCTLREKRSERDKHIASNVVFAAPPTGTLDYALELKEATRLWNRRGKFVFTSSTRTVLPDKNGVICETSPMNGSDVALAENQTISHDGTIVRLAGLYHLRRGPHAKWLKDGKVSGHPQGTVSLIHYDDAAMAVVNALLHGQSNATYLVADDVPLTRQQICEAAHKHPRFCKLPMPTFDSSGPRAKRTCNTTWTRQQLKFEPMYRSFEAFMQAEIAKRSSG